MAKMTITIPDIIVQDVITAFCSAYGYQAEIDDPANPGTKMTNPETKVQFARRQVREYVKNIYKAGQAKQFETGRKAVLDIAETAVSEVDVT